MVFVRCIYHLLEFVPRRRRSGRCCRWRWCQLGLRSFVRRLHNHVGSFLAGTLVRQQGRRGGLGCACGLVFAGHHMQPHPGGRTGARSRCWLEYRPVIVPYKRIRARNFALRLGEANRFNGGGVGGGGGFCFHGDGGEAPEMSPNMPERPGAGAPRSARIGPKRPFSHISREWQQPRRNRGSAQRTEPPARRNSGCRHFLKI